MSTTTQPSTEPEPAVGRRRRAEHAARQLAAISLAGLLLGLLVGGVGGRLAMMLLARLNPGLAGVVSDDGFVMGQFTLRSTAGLLVIATALGLLGAAGYALLRGLRIGPRWFQVLTISAGSAVVVGQLLVHTDGVDFRLLQPVGLAIALFVLIPGLYAALLTVLAERWLRPDSWFFRSRLRYVAPILLAYVVLVPLLPALVALAILWLIRDRIQHGGRDTTVLASPVGPWLVRAALALLFVYSGVLLVQEVGLLV
ncbi:MAG: hypothetical protein M3492_02155 [Actinomycetota bacterium]|nr:hypothetical protein [Actinomycetota bacterium]